MWRPLLPLATTLFACRLPTTPFATALSTPSHVCESQVLGKEDEAAVAVEETDVETTALTACRSQT